MLNVRTKKKEEGEEHTDTKEHKEILKVMGMFSTLVVVMASRVYTYQDVDIKHVEFPV